MTVDQRRVAVLGAGTIGESLITGLLSDKWREPGEIVATGRRDEHVAELRERLGVEATLSNVDAVTGAALVVIAVKPQDFDVLLGEIGSVVTAEQTVLSIAAAIPTSAIEARLADGVPVVRAMPNAPATVHEGIAGLCPVALADEPHLALAEEALAHLGAVVRVPEPYMDAVTAVSGSGPASSPPERRDAARRRGHRCGRRRGGGTAGSRAACGSGPGRRRDRAHGRLDPGPGVRARCGARA